MVDCVIQLSLPPQPMWSLSSHTLPPEGESRGTQAGSRPATGVLNGVWVELGRTEAECNAQLETVWEVS